MGEVDYKKILNDISKNKIVIHCKNEDEASDFLTKMGNLGVKWYGTQSNVCDNMNDYKKIHFKKEVCFLIKFYKYLNENVYSYCCIYSELEYFKTQRYKIIEWSNYMSFMPEDLEVGNIVEVNGNEYYIALKTDSEPYLNFHNLDDDCINLLKFHFSKSQISDDWVVKKDGVPDAVITKVYRNYNDFKQIKNEVYNRIPNDRMTYLIGDSNNKNHITISPNCDSCFNFRNPEKHNIYIEKDNALFNEFITIDYKILPEFIDALTDIKNMYEKVGVYAKSKDNEKPKIKHRSRYATSEEAKKVCDEEWTF